MHIWIKGNSYNNSPKMCASKISLFDKTSTYTWESNGEEVADKCIVK